MRKQTKSSTRKLVCGVGVNDADYVTTKVINGKTVRCPFYSRWSSMVWRCYGKRALKSKSVYFDCSVCDHWLVFSNFRLWMKQQDWKGKELDKDIIIPGNKVYSPSACAFVCLPLNRLLNGFASPKGDYAHGVHFNNIYKKYVAQIKINGKRKVIGQYLTPELAREAYIKVKVKLILSQASKVNDERVCNGLKLHADKLTEEIRKGEVK